MADAKSRKSTVQWRCEFCKRYLSSKRSYREHLNTHTQDRPFQCDKCDYAAASQMTLRRHRLRCHVSRTDWGYPCPYCSETYMEPASYQQHVSHRHFGNSCTYGCPHECCNFVAKSSKYFLDHIAKHLVIFRPNSVESKAYERGGTLDVQRFLIDDEIGTGYGKEPLEATIKRCENVLQYAKGSKEVDTSLEDNAKKKPARPKNAVSKPKIRPQRTVTPTPDPEPVETVSNDSPKTKANSVHEYSPCLIPGTESSFADLDHVELVPEDSEAYYQLLPENGQFIDNSQQGYYGHIEGYAIDELYENRLIDEFHQEVHDQPVHHDIQSDCLHPVASSSYKLTDLSQPRLPDGQVDLDLD